ncbi:MAG: hypothetical protein HQL32_04145 [Planctomycetes bacterium]|nr:hypothetical protein [Planctomycetota bacterium]
MLITTPIWSKARQPVDTALQLKDTITLGDKIDYYLTFECRPLANTENIVFKLRLPEEFTLVKGFSHWEGEISKGSIFTQKFIIKGPKELTKSVIISTKLNMEKSESLKNTIIKLGPATKLNKSTGVLLNQKTINRASEGKRRIRRE